ncbi:MAG: FlgD immunoglobulin-like domain containing protein [bacterium]
MNKKDYRKRPLSPHLSEFSRRDFLRLSAAASAGIAARPLLRINPAIAAVNETSRVVVVTDQAATIGSTIQPDIVRIMLNAGLQALTDAASPEEAWLTLIPDLAVDMEVGIKINCLNHSLPTHPEVSQVVGESLAAVPVGGGNFPLNQILIWDRNDYDLSGSDYIINSSTSGIRCFGTTHAGIGYNTELISVNGSNQRVSKIYTDYGDYHINNTVLKNHTITGITDTLKNQYGTINNPGALHGGYGNIFIPALNKAIFDTYGNKQPFCMCDALMGISTGGPVGVPQFVYNGLIFSQDTVAADAIIRQILDDQGCNTINMALHIDTASQPPYSLGNSALEDIELVEIFDPSMAVGTAGGIKNPVAMALLKNYPEPFNSGTTIPIELDRFTPVDVGIYDVKGRRIKTIHQGTLGIGHHTVTWSGMDQNGRPAASGKYIVKLTAGKQTHSRMITLLR